MLLQALLAVTLPSARLNGTRAAPLPQSARPLLDATSAITAYSTTSAPSVPLVLQSPLADPDCAWPAWRAQ